MDTELVDEQVPRLPIDGQCLCLPARSIEREHELRAETFAEWVVAHENLELSDELGVSSELEVSCDPTLDTDEMYLFEPKNLRLRERLVSEVGERWTAPEIESFAKSSRRQLGRGLLRLLHQPLEAEQVELVRADADHVARLLGHERLAGSERLAELGNVVLERVRRRLGRL